MNLLMVSLGGGGRYWGQDEEDLVRAILSLRVGVALS